MNLIGDLSTVEIGYLLILAGSLLLSILFAAQTVILSQRLRQRAALERRLEELAYVDELTGLPNRRLFQDRLHHALQMASRRGTTVAVIFLDLNEFKAVNDLHGHPAGDRVLTELASRWRSRFRAGDTIARWGGDEFVILAEDITSADAIQKLVARVRQTLLEPFVIDGQELNLSVTAGVAVGCSGAEDPAGLIQRADAAMYRSKRSKLDNGFELVGHPDCLARLGQTAVAPGGPEHQYVRIPA